MRLIFKILIALMLMMSTTGLTGLFIKELTTIPVGTQFAVALTLFAKGIFIICAFRYTILYARVRK